MMEVAISPFHSFPLHLYTSTITLGTRELSLLRADGHFLQSAYAITYYYEYNLNNYFLNITNCLFSLIVRY